MVFTMSITHVEGQECWRADFLSDGFHLDNVKIHLSNQDGWDPWIVVMLSDGKELGLLAKG
jgi:hypothetical protein